MTTTNHNTTKELSKINLEIKEVLNSINDYSESEIKNRFNTRDGYIVANIKVYDYLSESDILNTIKDYSNITESTKFAILEEFNSERLNNVFYHVCESEVSYLKEKYEGNCDITDFTKVFHVYNLSKRYETKEKAIEENIENDWYIKTYFHKAKKYKTFEAYKKAIQKENIKEFNDFINRNSINFDCWQFGRSGGWFSICKQSELENDWLYYYISYQAHGLLTENDNNTFNEIVNNLLNYNESKKQFLKRIKENLKDIEFCCFDYKEMVIPSNSLIYCDPPYKGSRPYIGENKIIHSEFWNWCREKVKEGHLVFVSEYEAPSDFECIWSKEVIVSGNNIHKEKLTNTEKLFVLKNI